MAGKFYDFDSIIHDKKYALSLSLSLAIWAIFLGAITVHLMQKQLQFEEIASVRLNDDYLSRRAAKSISEIDEKNVKRNSSYYGYLSNINEICKNYSPIGEVRTMVVRQPNGSAVIGKIRLSSDACAILEKLADKDYRFDVISALRDGDQTPSYVFIQKKTNAGS